MHTPLQISIDTIRKIVFATQLQPLVEHWYGHLLTENAYVYGINTCTKLCNDFKLDDITVKIFVAFMISYTVRSPFTVLLLKSCIDVPNVTKFTLVARKIRFCSSFKLHKNDDDGSVYALISQDVRKIRRTSPLLVVHLSLNIIHFMTFSGSVYYGMLDSVEHQQYLLDLPVLKPL